MRFIIPILFLCVTSFAAEEDLIGTWKAIPITVNGEKIERDETLIITDKTYQRIVGNEKRTGDLSVGQAPNNFGRAITLGADIYQIRISADLKALSLFKMIPEHRVQGGVMAAQVGPLSMTYERIGPIPAGLKERVEAKRVQAQVTEVKRGENFQNDIAKTQHLLGLLMMDEKTWLRRHPGTTSDHYKEYADKQFGAWKKENPTSTRADWEALNKEWAGPLRN